MNIIAADVGGTKTRLVLSDLVEPDHILYEARYLSSDYDSISAVIQTFIGDSGAVDSQIDTLVLALPGLVGESSAKLTNLPWEIDQKLIKKKFGINNVCLINDFQASALGTRLLRQEDTIVINEGVLVNGATQVTVGAGTGLGVAWLQSDMSSERAYSTEGGHIDFAPVNDEQIELLQFLRRRYEHVSYERILSGDGLVALYEFYTGEQQQDVTAEWVNSQGQDDEAAEKALSLFVKIYGAYVGNLALLFKPYGGIFITGGIGKKMAQRIQSEAFIEAYLRKGRMRIQVEQIPVFLVTNERVGVLGAISEAIKMKQVSK